MEKVNGVYVTNAAIVGGGMKNVETSPHEAKKLNSEIVKYDISTFYKPTTYERFSTWPDDIKRNYLYNCYWKHRGSTVEIAEMLGVTYAHICHLLKNHDIPTRRRGYKKSEDDKNAWARFLLGGTKLEDVLPKEVKEKLAGASEEQANKPTTEKPAESLTTPEGTNGENSDSKIEMLTSLLAHLSGSGAEVNIRIVI